MTNEVVSINIESLGHSQEPCNQKWTHHQQSQRQLERMFQVVHEIEILDEYG